MRVRDVLAPALFIGTCYCGEVEQDRLNRPPEGRIDARTASSFPRRMEVQFDADMSTDPDGDPLGYRWSLSVPPDSRARLTPAADAPAVFLKADLPGEYDLSLVVSDGRLDSEPKTVSL